MEQAIELAIADINQINDRLLRDFAKIPDDRLNWAPSSSARTPIQLMAHCANSLGFIREMLNGTPYPAKTTSQADAEFLEMEKQVTTREQALTLWKASFDRYVSYLNSVHSDQMNSLVQPPFGMDPVPLRFVVGVGSIHTREHVAQLEYLQTIYGDREW